VPELPEVEIASRNLLEWLGNRKIDAARIEDTRIARGASPKAIERLLVGRKVTGVERRGKWIRIALDSGAALYSHLGMTGKWVKRARGDEVRYERARVDAGKVSVRYLDPRLFGRLVPAPKGEAIAEWAALGRDPLRDGIDAKWLGAALSGRKAPLKIALLDQALLAGIGNIQATEALWRAKLHPERPAGALDAGELGRLVAAIEGTMADTLAEEAGPEITYVEEPGADNPFAVYGRGGEPCPRCRTALARSVLGGRGTVHCPKCQRR
jgi:formamidopyrimidine-DNA glycosylase